MSTEQAGSEAGLIRTRTFPALIAARLSVRETTATALLEKYGAPVSFEVHGRTYCNAADVEDWLWAAAERMDRVTATGTTEEES